MTARIANVSFHYGHEKRQRNRMHLDISPFDDRRATRAEVEAGIRQHDA